MLPPAKIFEVCSSVMAFIMMVKTVFNASVPPPLQKFVVSYLRSRFGARLRSRSSIITLTIEDKDRSGVHNQFYGDCSDYIGTKVSGDGKNIRVSKEKGGKNLTFSMNEHEVLSDLFEGVKLDYKFFKVENADPGRTVGQAFLEIKFDEKYRDLVLYQYLPYVERKAAEMRSENRKLMVHTNSPNNRWDETTLVHPSTFDTMAMDEELKLFVINDIDRFIQRKDFYRKVGKAWKRGYLLYGPPGTGKSSLAAAIANHLRFDIYDLQLTCVKGDSELKKLLLGTTNGSILLLEDIDRSSKLEPNPKPGVLSLAGLLNCLDGVGSACGEERIIIFTTNHRETLDSALVRPGRMDVPIHMGYCCFDGFKTLASNYLDLQSPHRLFPEVERLINRDLITPAEVAEEFMKEDDAEVALQNLVTILQRRSQSS